MEYTFACNKNDGWSQPLAIVSNQRRLIPFCSTLVHLPTVQERFMKYIPTALLLATLLSAPAMANKLESYVEDAKEKVSDVSEWSKDKAGDAADWSKDALQDASEVSKETFKDAAEWSKDKAEVAVDWSKDKAGDAKEWAEENIVDDKPWWKFWE
jgi:gas vesicle protein